MVHERHRQNLANGIPLDSRLIVNVVLLEEEQVVEQEENRPDDNESDHHESDDDTPLIAYVGRVKAEEPYIEDPLAVHVETVEEKTVKEEVVVVKEEPRFDFEDPERRAFEDPERRDIEDSKPFKQFADGNSQWWEIKNEPQTDESVQAPSQDDSFAFDSEDELSLFITGWFNTVCNAMHILFKKFRYILCRCLYQVRITLAPVFAYTVRIILTPLLVYIHAILF